MRYGIEFYNLRHRVPFDHFLEVLFFGFTGVVSIKDWIIHQFMFLFRPLCVAPCCKKQVETLQILQQLRTDRAEKTL